MPGAFDPPVLIVRALMSGDDGLSVGDAEPGRSGLEGQGAPGEVRLHTAVIAVGPDEGGPVDADRPDVADRECHSGEADQQGAFPVGGVADPQAAVPGPGTAEGGPVTPGPDFVIRLPERDGEVASGGEGPEGVIEPDRAPPSAW